MDQQLDIKKIIWKKLFNRTYVLVLVSVLNTKGSNVPASPGQKLSEKEFSQYPVHIVYSYFFPCTTNAVNMDPGLAFNQWYIGGEPK